MAFLSSFASYLMVFVIFVCVIAVGFFIGTTLRKNKDRKDAASSAVQETEGASEK